MENQSKKTCLSCSYWIGNRTLEKAYCHKLNIGTPGSHLCHFWTTKPTRGGKREGAGRKPLETPREAITVRLEPQDVAKMRNLCAAREMSQADWITEKIRRSRV